MRRIVLYYQYFKWEDVMKKIVIQLFVLGVLVASYVTPVLACGGGGN